MKIFYKVYYIYKNYNIIKNLKWTKKGIFIYIMLIIGIIKSIISNPIYKIIKKIVNLLIIFEGILLVIYYTELPIYNLKHLSITLTTIYIFIQETYIKLLKFIREKLDYLLDNNPFEENNQSKEIIKPNENNTSNKSFYWWIGISIVIISSTIAIYYYYPNILDYFNNGKGDGPNPNNLNIDTKVNNIIDSPNTPISINPDPNATPKPSSSNLPPVVD